MPPSIIITTTKNDANTPWITSDYYDTTYLTHQEHTDHIDPHWNWIETLPGYVSNTLTVTETTKTLQIEFKDFSDVYFAMSRLKGITKHSKVKNRDKIITQKMNELGLQANVHYTVSVDFTTE